MGNCSSTVCGQLRDRYSLLSGTVAAMSIDFRDVSMY